MSGPDADVAFVFPSGGSSGAVQVGILTSLLEAGIVPTMLVGSSVGALNAAYMAAGPTVERAAALETIWRRLSRVDVFGSNRCSPIARLIAGRSHVYTPAALRTLIATFCPLNDLSDGQARLEVVTTDLEHGVARWWKRGPATEILYASACLPGLFPPAELEGHLHVDGGVLEPCPAQRALELDASQVFVLGDLPALDVATSRKYTALDVLIRSFTISRYAKLPEPATLTRHRQQVMVVPGADTSGIAIHDFTHTARLISESREISRKFLGLFGANAAAEPFRAEPFRGEPIRAGAEQVVPATRSA